MKDFVLVDLVAQRAEVRTLLAGRSMAEIVNWLGSFGVATVRVSGSRELIEFRSSSGMNAMFFVEGDAWVFIGDGSTFVSKPLPERALTPPIPPPRFEAPLLARERAHRPQGGSWLALR